MKTILNELKFHRKKIYKNHIDYKKILNAKWEMMKYL